MKDEIKQLMETLKSAKNSEETSREEEFDMMETYDIGYSEGYCNAINYVLESLQKVIDKYESK